MTTSARNVSAEPAFEAAIASFHQALRSNDEDGVFAYVSDDVRLMPPAEPAIRGKSAMREWFAGFLSLYRTTSLEFSDREVMVGGNWALELGTYEWIVQPAAGGEAVVDRGNYMQLWKLHGDGRWRFEREIWNSSAIATAQAAD